MRDQFFQSDWLFFFCPKVYKCEFALRINISANVSRLCPPFSVWWLALRRLRHKDLSTIRRDIQTRTEICHLVASVGSFFFLLPICKINNQTGPFASANPLTQLTEVLGDHSHRPRHFHLRRYLLLPSVVPQHQPPDPAQNCKR